MFDCFGNQHKSVAVEQSVPTPAPRRYRPRSTHGDRHWHSVLVLYLKADLPPVIVFFGEHDNWKKGWDIAYGKWKSLGTETIDLQMAPDQGHGFFSHSTQWQTVTLIAADRFLVKHGFLTGEPTLKMPASGEKLVPAP